MAKDNNQFAREKELAREYEKKMAERKERAQNKINQLLEPFRIGPYEPKNFSTLFGRLYVPAFSQGKYQKPSEFFQAEMPWIYEYIIYDRFREAFHDTVDRVLEYPYSVGWGRRSFRSSNYLHYGERIADIVDHFRDVHCLDADICDVLTGNLLEDALCYLKTRNTRTAGFCPEVLAYELDRDNPRLEEIVTDIVNGDSEFATVSHELIQGIVLSRNPRMHQLLCRLLVAARLQEGLRQVICENADWGTVEAFHAILSTILEHDLIRYSSVKRAVGTWIGAISYETRDLDRISNKSVELICKCLMDRDFRAECLHSEDAMAIHIALWSAAFENVQRGYETLDRIIEQGTHHQVLTAGYFVANLESPLLRQISARNALASRREHYDILAVYLPSLIPNANYTATTITNGTEDPNLKRYFVSHEQAIEMCDWLMEVCGSMKGKELVFDPCIFPWYAASVKKSDLVEKAMIIAVMAENKERIEKLCSHLTDCVSDDRQIYFRLLTRGEKTPVIRQTIIDCMEDKSFSTRRAAFESAKGLDLTPEEYRQVEGMLRLRYDDLRRNAMELLLKQPDEVLQATIRRLLGSSKAPMRTAGLDMVTQLRKNADRKDLAESCMEFVHAMKDPSSQEQILIDTLTPKQEKKAEPLFTEADRYVPVVQIDEYARDCIRAFMELFPESRLEEQVLAGKPVHHSANPGAIPLCDAVRRAKENLKSLSDLLTANETSTFTSYWGDIYPIGCALSLFRSYDKETGNSSVPRMELWERWRDDNAITPADLLGMFVLSSGQSEDCAYLKRCGRYIADLYGPGFQESVTYRYAGHVHQIIHDLLFRAIPYHLTQMLATAIGIWIAGCVPEDMLLGCGDDMTAPEVLDNMASLPEDEQRRVRIIAERQIDASPVGHFIVHPQIGSLFGRLNLNRNRFLATRLPIAVYVCERTFESTKAFMQALGLPVSGRVTMVMKQLFSYHGAHSYGPDLPDAATWLYACHDGLISRRTLYCHLMERNVFKNSLELLTAVCAIHPEEGKIASARAFSMYNGQVIRRTCERFLGEDPQLNEEQLELVSLCRQTAEVMVGVVVGAELNRGDTPTEYSRYVTGIHVLYGMETFVKILTALGKDSLDRSVYYWGSNNSKRGNLSYLLARCTPVAGDTAEKLARLVKGTDITTKRLIEAALYSPAWIDIIGQYLKLDGFKSACYYFMAHMNERFDEEKKAVIARYSPLSEDEFNLGAFDVDWFRSAYAQLGEKTFDQIYDAAKYISDGNKHTRARKFADAALGKMEVSATEEIIRNKRNKDLLMAYAIIPLGGEDDLIHRYLYIQQFLKESRQFGAQRSASEKKAVEAALRNLATNAGFSDTMRLTLRMETKLVEDSRELFEDKQIGEWMLRLEIDGEGSAAILCTKDGKVLKSIPAKVKKDPYVLRLQDMKKQLTDQYRRTRRMFEQAMEDGASFTLSEMRQLAENRVAASIVSKLVFKSGECLGFFNGENLTDLEGKVLSGESITVAHPFHLYTSGQWPAFQKHLFDNQIVQPFRQVFRELYVKTPDELGAFRSLRYAGNQIQPKKAAACLKERRWVADIEAGLQKVYYRENIVATLYALADWFTPADIEAPTLEYVAFYHRKTGKPLKIDEIPDVIFSEVMRDVDMVVSVAHAGGVDPETSYSTVEMRAAILSFTLPLLRLENVRLEGSHAFIDGKLGKYAVHLGSGVVHQIGGTMLNVLPVHSQHRGRIFLPFVDDDPKTAEIISKVILFSEDKKLKDPSILSQIIRT